ncbi:copper chaperone PCu(A)C [Brucella oryzae]|uniref:copper chaperone PCu(A)C n=1 Tax=Brucella oryzae TaxID=335286 RepID=UPI003D15FD44
MAIRDGEGIPLEIPSRRTVRLQPGRLHLMLLDITDVPDPGATIPLTLIFRDAGRIDLSCQVHAPP